ncbi:NADH dehydrogenase [Halolactibacillus miurensis]|uniref:NADH dehydrogenase n=1 Tax=Halolactibacillus miurensis TaxID=306541 RepID=A0A1I6RDF2_9BACI|nr:MULTISPECIES: FAD-dependent oxidoreductase [Halolactibacillus]GEM05489.1 NADH dehydrogenase [Halolactibacillus miurensis]SFS62685.1 NADH dehydrogenase [Halolactibacillus miurensis]
MTHIVVLGAGYAGLTTVLRLQKKLKHQDVFITLINKHRYHYQTTWLHRCAVGLYSEDLARIDLATVLDEKRVTLKKETVKKIRPDMKQVTTDQATYTYDYLVVALGAEINTSEVPGLESHAHSIVTLARANRLYNRLLTVIADYQKSNRSDSLKIVVGGGGFTGIELVGELKEQLPKLLEQYQVSPTKAQITLIEKASTVLPEFNLELGEYALSQLEAEYIDIKLQTAIKAIARHTVKVERGGIIEELPHDLFIWTAGVSTHAILQTALFQHQAGPVRLTDDLTVEGYPDVYIIGDAAETTGQSNEKVLPNADLAIQKGKYCANHLLAKIDDKQRPSHFSFKAYGSRIASIGQRDAIGLLWNKKKVVGYTAAMIKRVTDHIVVLQMGGLVFWSHVFKRSRRER